MTDEELLQTLGELAPDPANPGTDRSRPLDDDEDEDVEDDEEEEDLNDLDEDDYESP